MIRGRMRWREGATLLGIGLTMTCTLPEEGFAHPNPGTSAWQGIHKEDFASRTYRTLLRNQKDLQLSPEQVRTIESQSIDYAKTRIRNDAAVSLAEVDVRALLTNPRSELSSIETALQQSATAQTLARLERVKAIRTVLAVLTPEQQDLWRAQIRGRHRHGHSDHPCEKTMATVETSNAQKRPYPEARLSVPQLRLE